MKKTIIAFLITILFSAEATSAEVCEIHTKSVSYNLIKTKHVVVYAKNQVCKPQMVKAFTVIKSHQDPDDTNILDVDYSLNWSKENHDLWHVATYEVRLNNDDNQISEFDYEQTLPLVINLPDPEPAEGLAQFEVRACSALPDVEAVCGDWQPTQTQCENSCTDSSYPIPQLSVSTNYSNTGDFLVSWSGGNYSEYELRMSVSGGQFQTVYSGDQTSYSFENQPNGIYAFQVKNINNNIYSNFSATNVIEVDLEIPTFNSLSAVNTTGSYIISWGPVNYDAEVVRYKLLQSIDSGESWAIVANKKINSFEFNDQPNNINYQYKVKACKAQLNCSDFSDYMAVKVELEKPIFGSLPAQSATGEYTVNWSVVEYEDENTIYELQQKTIDLISGNESEWSTQFNGTGYQMNFTGQATGYAYSYRVRACKANAYCSDFNEGLSISVASLMPASFEVYEDNHANRRYLTWDPSANAQLVTHYLLEARDDSGNILDTYYNLAGESSFIEADYSGAAPTKYRIKACNSSGCSQWLEKTINNSFYIGLTSVVDLAVLWDTSDAENPDIKFEFKYPDTEFGDINGGRPDYFKLMSTFPQENGSFEVARTPMISSSVSNQDPWTFGYLDRSSVIGSSFAVLACNHVQGCSLPATIAVGEPVIDPSIPQPTSITAIVTEVGESNPSGQIVSATEIQLNWEFDASADLEVIDYIQIFETKPIIYENNVLATQGTINSSEKPELTFYTHEVDQPLTLNRIGRGEYKYAINACKKITDGPDRCSEKTELIDQVQVLRTEVMNASPISLPALHPNTMGFEKVNITDSSGSILSSTYHIYWKNIYSQSEVKPDYFLLSATEGQFNPWCESEYLDYDTISGVPIERNTLYDSIKIEFADKGYVYPTGSNSSNWSSLIACHQINIDGFDYDGKMNTEHGGSKLMIRACKKGVGCSDTIEFADYTTKTVDQSQIQNPQTPSTDGPGGLASGQYWHPALSGTGWHFYWANGLKNNQSSGTYADTYDLFGYWLAYRATDEGWTPAWYEVRLKKTQVLDAGVNMYQGNLYYHKRNSSGQVTSLDTGNVMVKLNPNDNTKAIMLLNIDDSEGPFTQADQSDNISPYTECIGQTTPGFSCNGSNPMMSGLLLDIEHFSISNNLTTFEEFNDADHYSGLWQYNVSDSTSPLETAELSMLPWIHGGLEYLVFLYYDTDGNPIWVQAQSKPLAENGTTPGAGYFEDYQTLEGEEKTLYTVQNGFNPLAARPQGFKLRDNIVTVGKAGRQFESNPGDTDFNTAKFWMDVNTDIMTGNESRSITKQLGAASQQSWLSIEKRANLHGIKFNINEFNDSEHTCDLNESMCNIYLTWYTDDNFGAASGQAPNIIPRFHSSLFPNQGFKPLSELCNDVPTDADAVYLTSKFKCEFKAPYDAGGEFTFEYAKREYESNVYFPIAQSEKLTVIGCSSNTGCGEVTPTPTVIGDPIIPATNIDPTDIIDHQPGAGPLPGSGGVSGGAATYSLPLVIPPGRNGVTPELSLNYSSKGGIGMMGAGWSTSIGSTIYRCPQTQAQDENSHFVDFSDNDRLCLDGQRLMIETSTYWTDGSTYRTEIDSFALTTKVSDTQFKVQTKSGLTNTYDQFSDDGNSRWYISKSEDSFGNFISYQYKEFGEKEFLIEQISYTGKGNDLGDRKIKFTYTDRITPEELSLGDVGRYDVQYNAGIKTEQTKLLTQIKTYTNNITLNRTYDFNYESSRSNNELLLSSVTEKSGAESRTLLENNWSGSEWSNASWLDNAADNFKYESIINEENEEILGERYETLLGKATIDNDYDGDGIKEYLAISESGEKRSLFFFDHNNVIKAEIKLPNNNMGANRTRAIGAADLTFNGYTDLVDNLHVYSWKINKQLPNNGQFISRNFSQYFNQITVPFSYPDDLFLPLNNNVQVSADQDKTQSYFIDYNKDGLVDLIQYVTPNVTGGLQNSTYQGTAKILLHINKTDPNSCTASNCNLSFETAKVLVDGLRPYIDLEGEDDLWFFMWDAVTDVSDFNGDGYPDVHLTRWVKVALYNEFDYEYRITNEQIVFTHGENETSNVITDGVRLSALGLSHFTCQIEDVDGTIIDEACDASPQSISDNKVFHFADVNNDGLKDFVYYDFGEYYIKSWKVRLNQGGDPTGNAALFGDTYSSDLNDPANSFSMTQPGECIRDAESKYSTSELARKCNPYFRAATYMNDLDSDGVPELIMPDHRVNDDTSKPANMVFNFCSTFNVGQTYNTRNTTNLNQDNRDSNSPQYSVVQLDNIIPRYSDWAAVDGAPIGEQAVKYDPLLQQASLYPYTDETKPVFEPGPGFRDFIRDYVGVEDPLSPNAPNTSTTIDWACAYNGNNQIWVKPGPLVGSQGRFAKDMYQDFSSASALADRSVYRYNAIKFDLSEDKTLKLTLSEKTGIYKTLFQGSVGDLSGNGISDSLSTVGCIYGSEFCKSLVDFTTHSAVVTDDGATWDVDADKLRDFGTPLIGKNEAEMPNMLLAVTKPNTGQWVSWDYHPLTADITFDRMSGLPLYRLPERECTAAHITKCPDGYINESGGKGSHIFFNSSMYVVSEMRQSNSLQNTNSEVQYDTTQYGYEEAVYNIKGRGFQGFRTITTDHYPMVNSDLNQTRSRSTFSQVFPIAGKLETIESFNNISDGLKLTQLVEYTWDTENNISSAVNPLVIFHPLESMISEKFDYDDQERVLVNKQEQKFNANFCGHTDVAYDGYGNNLCMQETDTDFLKVKKQDQNSSGLVDSDLETKHTKTISTTFNAPQITQGNWWVDKLKSTVVETKVVENGGYDSPHSTTALNRSSKNLMIWQAGTNRKLACQYAMTGAESLPTDCDDNNVDNTKINKNAFKYDSWGNISEVTTTGRVSDFSDTLQQRISRTNYSASEGYFANQAIQVLGDEDSGYTTYTTNTTYDVKTGQVKTTSDPAGIKTTITYDEFGALTQSAVTLTANTNDRLEAPTVAAMKLCGNECATQQTLIENLIGEINSSTISNSGFYFQTDILVPQLTFVSQAQKPASPITTSWLDQNGQVVLSRTMQSSDKDAYVLSLTNPLGQAELITQPFTVSANGVNYIDNDDTINRSNPYFTFNGYDERGRKVDQLIDVGKLSETVNADNCKRQTTYEHNMGQTQVTAGFTGADCANVESVNNNLVMYRTYDYSGKLRQTVDAMKYITQYWYDSMANPHIITDADGNHIITRFDDLGRKTSVDDPNMGVKTFRYNSFGEVFYEQDAVQANHPNNPANYTFYDQWGRITQKLTNSYISGGLFEPISDGRSYLDTYNYSTVCGFGHNILCGRYRSSNYDSISASHEDDFYIAHSIQYTYDKFGRLASENTEMPNVLGDYQGSDGNLTTAPTMNTNYFYYEDHNLPKQTIHDNIRGVGLSVVNHYDAYGSLVKQVENPSGETLMEVNGWTLRGQPKTKFFNTDNTDQIKTAYQYHPGTGQVSRIVNHKPGNDQYFYYTYDAWGNINSQRLFDGTTERFKYDKLQRLKESYVDNQAVINYEYDDNEGAGDSLGLGNMVSKSDYSTNQRYQEIGNAGPNAITSAALNSGGTLSYSYDKNGNRIKDTLAGTNQNGIQATYSYDAYNLLIASERPAQMQQISYLYGIDNLRYAKHENTFDEANQARREITLYLGPQFEQVINTTTHEIETKFQLTDYLTITLNNLNRQTRHFTQKDRLGSTTQILDENGVIVHTKGYDAFGKPRNGTDWSPMAQPVLDFESDGSIDITKRGFTDHEHLDAFELIHMNGRMYDFNNGRFLSVDPFIQGTTSQAINPYSYIQNNPLSGTDPTGYAFRELTSTYGCNTTFDGGCAQDGNIFAQAASKRGQSASFNGLAPSGIGVRKSGPGDVSDTESQENVNYCSGALQCYLIGKNDDGEFVNQGVTDALGEYNFINGILNNKENAGTRLGPVHLDEKIIGESVDSFVLIHNPTEKMIKDGVETFKDKFGHTEAAKQLAALISKTNAKGKQFSIVAHSQGTAILKSAVKYHMKKGGGKISNLRIRLHGPAINVALGRRTFNKAGIGFFGRNGGIDINSGDAVPNIIGGNTVNPIHILKSLFLSPTLSSKIGDGSPHTFPVGCDEGGCK